MAGWNIPIFNRTYISNWSIFQPATWVYLRVSVFWCDFLLTTVIVRWWRDILSLFSYCIYHQTKDWTMYSTLGGFPSWIPVTEGLHIYIYIYICTCFPPPKVIFGGPTYCTYLLWDCTKLGGPYSAGWFAELPLGCWWVGRLSGCHGKPWCRWDL